MTETTDKWYDELEGFTDMLKPNFKEEYRKVKEALGKYGLDCETFDEYKAKTREAVTNRWADLKTRITKKIEEIDEYVSNW